MHNGVREPDGRTGLRGRASECALLDDLISAIGRGEGRSLVVRGEAGIGKSALLDHLVASASELAVVRAAGVESDMELAHAGLHQLCGRCSTSSRLSRLLNGRRSRSSSGPAAARRRIASSSARPCSA
jgi:hypothetical protein